MPVLAVARSFHCMNLFRCRFWKFETTVSEQGSRPIDQLMLAPEGYAHDLRQRIGALAMSDLVRFGGTGREAQTWWRYLDLNSDAHFTKADMTRADVEAVIGGCRFERRRGPQAENNSTGWIFPGSICTAPTWKQHKAQRRPSRGSEPLQERSWIRRGVSMRTSRAPISRARASTRHNSCRAKLDDANLKNARVAGDLSQPAWIKAHLDSINIVDGKPARDSRRHPFVLRLSEA